MAGRAVALLLAVALAAVVLHPAPAAAAGQKKPATAARREDIPYIRCQVCERIAREISAQVAKKQQALPPSKKVLFCSGSGLVRRWGSLAVWLVGVGGGALTTWELANWGGVRAGAGDRDHRHRGECVQPEEAGGGLDAPDRYRRER